MFRIRDLKNGLFQVHSKKHQNAYEGTPKSILGMAITMGIDSDDAKYALDELTKHNHDYADFGVLGTFIFSTKNSFTN